MNGAIVQGTFRDAKGDVLWSQNKPIVSIKENGDTEDITRNPIRPNQSRMVRMIFDSVPKAWGHQVPNLRIVTVTGTQ